MNLDLQITMGKSFYFYRKRLVLCVIGEALAEASGTGGGLVARLEMGNVSDSRCAEVGKSLLSLLAVEGRHRGGEHHGVLPQDVG